ncbi:MAG: hypothetical protein H7Y12_15920, partial [Sphingobacteriaceae bacterium]|nr:hypothetical protein [Cytophagaceae bacterium]
FTVSPDGVRASILTGDHFPFAQRPLRHPHFLFPILVPPQQTLTAYLWVDKHGEQVQIPLRLWDKAVFETNGYQLHLFAGFMLGIIGLYTILSLFTALFFRQKLTLYYFGYTVVIWFFMAAHTGFGFALLWPRATWWTSAARPTTVLLIYVFSLLFAQEFFHLRKTYRWLYRYTQGLLGVIGVLLLIYWSQHPALGWFKNYWYNPVYYAGDGLLRFMIAVHLVAVVSLVSVMGIGVLVFFRTRKVEGLWFAFGYTMLLLSGFLIIFVHAGYWPDTYVTQNIPLIATGLETVILSILLANRFKTIYQDNARISEELAGQRQRNALQLLEGQRIERRRLSQELHDGISLSLTNVRLRLSMLAEKLTGQGPEVQRLVDALGEVGQDVRQFSHALSPVMLERYGLVDALDELIHTLQGSHPDVALSFQHRAVHTAAMQPLVAQTLYLISIELLNTVLKHAQAHRASLDLTQTGNVLRLDVTDDGIGYDPPDPTSGIGLQNIEARVHLLNGRFSIQRLPVGMRHTVEIEAQTSFFS